MVVRWVWALPDDPKGAADNATIMPAIAIRAHAFVTMVFLRVRASSRHAQPLVRGDAVGGSSRGQFVDHRGELLSADRSADRLIGLDGIGLVLVVGGHCEE